MSDKSTWQMQAVEQLSQFFNKEVSAKAFVLTGSLAAKNVQEDVWSDVDAKIVLTDNALDDYYAAEAWLVPFGKLVGAERHVSQMTRTLRVCLAGFQRFDLTFIAESTLREPLLWQHNPFEPAYIIVWSEISELETQIAALRKPTGYQDMAAEEIERIVDAFWFKSALAITKIARNDCLIGLHLALDLMRDVLVLQMIRRDRVLGTTVHRMGGWGNEIAARLNRGGHKGSRQDILNLIRESGEVFDELALELLPGYQRRSSLLLSSIYAAKQACYA